MRHSLIFSLLVGSAALSACLPLPYTFHQLHYPGGRNSRTGKCSGPGDELKFAFHDIYISARIDSEGRPDFGVDIHVPAGHVVRLETAEAVITSKTSAGETQTPISLGLFNLGKTENNGATQRLVGWTDKERFLFGVEEFYGWFRFTAAPGRSVEAGDEGQLKLPNLYIDDVLYPGPVIPYRRVTRISMDSLNC